MPSESRTFTARLLVAASGVLFPSGWLFLRAGTGRFLLTVGVVFLVGGLARDRSRATLLLALASVALGIAVLLLLTLPTFF
ncbi:MAG: hypothetical protein ABI939_09835 [Anaerolineaceae bacterium]